MQREDTHIPFLDHIRGVAILMVFLFHSLGLAYGFDHFEWKGWFPDFDVSRTFLMLSPLIYGSTGVSVFFVVSGFCIHLSYQRSGSKDIATFFTRRFFRIYPPYLVALLVFGFLYPWHLVNLSSKGGIHDFLSHLFLVHNAHSRYFMGINPSFWSIAVEFQLYLIYPLLVLLVNKLGWKKTLWITAMLEAGIRIGAGYHSMAGHAEAVFFNYRNPLGFWFSWTIGAAAADAFLHRRSLPFSKVPVWIFPLLTIGFAFVRPLTPFVFPLAALSTVSIIGMLLERSKNRVVGGDHIAGRHLAFAGIVSYSLYLLHQPIIKLIPEMAKSLLPGTHFHPLVLFAICCAAWFPIMGISWCFYRWCEMPSIEAGKAVIRRIRMSGKARSTVAAGVSPSSTD